MRIFRRFKEDLAPHEWRTLTCGLHGEYSEAYARCPECIKAEAPEPCLEPLTTVYGMWSIPKHEWHPHTPADDPTNVLYWYCTRCRKKREE